jgi:hypothetical protein
MSLETFSPHTSLVSDEAITSRQNPEQLHGDASERAHLLEAADTLAAMEAQFEQAKPDEKIRLQQIKESLLTELSAESPGFALLNDVILLASVYQKRVTETILPHDGSRVRAFGTRDKHNLWLEQTYILHEKPGGGYHYLVQRRSEQGVYIFELDDQEELSITKQPDRSKPLNTQPRHLATGNDEYRNAVKELLGTTLTAIGAIRQRDELSRANADMHALFLIEDSSFAGQFLNAESSGEVMERIDALMAIKPQVMSMDAMAAVIASRRKT